MQAGHLIDGAESGDQPGHVGAGVNCESVVRLGQVLGLYERRVGVVFVLKLDPGEECTRIAHDDCFFRRWCLMDKSPNLARRGVGAGLNLAQAISDAHDPIPPNTCRNTVNAANANSAHPASATNRFTPITNLQKTTPNP